MAKPGFTTLWASYPVVKAPCDGPWDNQCAIRMSIALNGEGSVTVNSKNYSEPKCRHGHARGAESLANWLQTKIGRPKKWKSGEAAKKDLQDDQGIIFFKDCFTRAGSTAQVGDHIDLWRKGITKTFSDPNNSSKEVWFWAL